MQKECPHCYLDVTLNPDDNGICPECGKDTYEQTELEDYWTSVTLQEDSILPFLCCQCGLPSTRKVKVTQSQEIPDLSSEESYGCLSVFLMMYIGPIFAIFAKGFFPTQKSVMTLTVESSITQCKGCKKQYKKVVPYEVNYPERSMTVLVNKDFATEFLIENKNSNSRE